MAVQIKQIRGDIVELLFDPREEDLRVGENLSLHEPITGRGLVVQVIEFRTVTYPSLIAEMLELAVEGTQPLPESLSIADLSTSLQGLPPISNLKIAIAKVRKLIAAPNTWDQWDGWIPSRDVVIERTGDEELFAHCLRRHDHALFLGQTLADQEFIIEGQDLEKVNIITGTKGSGKSHLAKVILLQLIRQGAPCLVFDINREYIHLPPHGQGGCPGIIHLEAGENFRLGLREFGLPPLMTLLERYGLPEISAMHFQNRVNRLLAEVGEWEAQGKKPPFLSIEQLVQMAEAREFAAGHSMTDAINGAIKSRLEALKYTRLFARHPQEAVSLHQYYQEIRTGGALVLDVSGLGNLARTGLVQAIIEMIKDICQEEIRQQTYRLPFVFFEEAHLYVSRASIDYVVTRARHLGITSFFITNMIGGLDEAVLRQADNLFLLRLPYEDDIQHVAKSALVDKETIASFVVKLRYHHALAIGNATGQYPFIFRVDPLEGVNTAGETQFFFRTREESHQERSLPRVRRRAASTRKAAADSEQLALLPVEVAI